MNIGILRPVNLGLLGNLGVYIPQLKVTHGGYLIG